jgi:hypothetical protein
VIHGHLVTCFCLGVGDDAVVVGVEERDVLLQRRRPDRSTPGGRRLAPFSESSKQTRIISKQVTRKGSNIKRRSWPGSHGLTEGYDDEKQQSHGRRRAQGRPTLSSCHGVGQCLLDPVSLAPLAPDLSCSASLFPEAVAACVCLDVPLCVLFIGWADGPLWVRNACGGHAIIDCHLFRGRESSSQAPRKISSDCNKASTSR